tara:strand:+ start:3555 stop:3797 length:243 start_codon:yes stop_codon:yes gene_type:complete
MELYNPEEYSRPTAIWAQFEVMRKKIEEQDKRIKELENTLESSQTEAREQFNTNIMKSKQNRDRIEALENKIEELTSLLP